LVIYLFFNTDRKTAKSGSDAISLVLKGNYELVVAVVDYSQCQLIRDSGDAHNAPVFNIIGGGVIDTHIVIETRPSGTGKPITSI
jgi:hypothetical protein